MKTLNKNSKEKTLSTEEIEKANQKSVEIYYQQAIETFNWLSKKNENIKNKSGLLLTFLCGAVGFCITCFISNQQNYRCIFLITAILYWFLSLFVCFKLFLTKLSINPFYPVQTKDDQKEIYKNSQNDVLTTVVNEYTKPAIENAKEINDKLSNNFDFAVKLAIFAPLVATILHIIVYYRSCLLQTLLKPFV